MDVSFPKNYHKNVWNPIKAVNDSKSPQGFFPPSSSLFSPCSDELVSWEWFEIPQ